MSLGYYRATEDGNQRVLEDSVGLRVTENYKVGEASLTATGSVNFVGNLIVSASASFSGTSTVNALATLRLPAVLALSASSTLQAVPKRTTRGTASFVATGSLLASPTFKGSAISNLVASSDLTANARTVKFAFIFSGTDSLGRSLENDSDVRITEDGDFRFTNDVTVNVIESSMVAVADVIPFNSIAYIKLNGVWKLITTIDAKNNSSWGNLDKVYRNMSGKWKRIY
jgi:hypothetical protein